MLIPSRLLFQACGWASIGVGVVGIFLPLLPTVPFMLLAAYCFSRSNPALEARLLRDPRFGPHILAWRERGAISRRAKLCALAGFGGSAVMGLVFLPLPWALVPLGVGIISGTWIWRRPEL